MNASAIEARYRAWLELTERADSLPSWLTFSMIAATDAEKSLIVVYGIHDFYWTHIGKVSHDA